MSLKLLCDLCGNEIPLSTFPKEKHYNTYHMCKYCQIKVNILIGENSKIVEKKDNKNEHPL